MLFWLKGVVSGARIPAPTASRQTHVAPESFWDVSGAQSHQHPPLPQQNVLRANVANVLQTAFLAIRNTVGFILRISRSISIIAIIPILQKTN